MKKLLFLCLLFSLTFITTGCVKSVYNIEIDKRGNIKTSETQALNVTFLKTFDSQIDKKIKKEFNKRKSELEKNDFSAELYSDDNFSGIIKSKDFKIKTFKNEDLPVGFSCERKAPVILDKRAFSDVYTIELLFEPKKAMEENKKNAPILNEDKKEQKPTEQLQEQPQEQQAKPDVTVQPMADNSDFEAALEEMYKEKPELAPSAELVIKTPYPASSHNATRVVNDNEYHWNLASKDPVEINIVFGKICISRIIFVLLTLGVFGFFLYRFYEYQNTSNW